MPHDLGREQPEATNSRGIRQRVKNHVRRIATLNRYDTSTIVNTIKIVPYFCFFSTELMCLDSKLSSDKHLQNNHGVTNEHRIESALTGDNGCTPLLRRSRCRKLVTLAIVVHCGRSEQSYVKNRRKKGGKAY